MLKKQQPLSKSHEANNYNKKIDVVCQPVWRVRRIFVGWGARLL